VNRHFWLLVLLLSLVTAAFIGCTKSNENYRSGMYWLEKEGNWQQASRCFQRALQTDPDNWKIHAKLIETLAMGATPDTFELNLRTTLSYFPDSARSTALARPGEQVLGADRYAKLSSSFELQHLTNIIARNPENVKLLSRGIMAACRNKDNLTLTDYFKRLLDLHGDKPVADSILQEMRFFIGPSQVEWLQLEWRIAHHPDDVSARLAQIDAGVIVGDSSGVRKRLTALAKVNAPAVKSEDLARRYGCVVGSDPFGRSELARGWNGNYAPDGRSILFLKNMGDSKVPDVYIYEKNLSNGSESPLLKAAQQNLGAIALPVYTPDKRWIYFYGSNDRNWKPGGSGRFTLYRVRPFYNSRAEKVCDADMIITEPCFHSDGSVLLVRRDLGSVRSSAEIIKVRPETREQSSVSRIGEPISSATFTPNGDSLVFITDRGVFRRAVDGGKIFVDLNWVGMGFPQLSPDGRWLKLINPAGQMLLIDRNTAAPMFFGSTSSPWAAFKDGSEMLISVFSNGWERVQQVRFNLPVKNLEAFAASVEKK